MKNIIIAGTSRTGKSTLSKRLVKAFPSYNFIQQDILGPAFERAYVAMQSDKCEDKDKLTINMSEVAKYSNIFFDYYIDFLLDLEDQFNYLIEVFDFTFEKLKEYKDKGFIVVVLGNAYISEEELFKNIRKHDTENDRTYFMSNFNLKLEVGALIKMSKRYEEECKKFDLPYFDTSKEREKILDDAYDFIVSKI